jgi:hypothetical protein
MARALKLEAAGVEAHPIATDSFGGLTAGQFAVVLGAFATRARQRRSSRALRPKKIKATAKESGPLRGGGRLRRNSWRRRAQRHARGVAAARHHRRRRRRNGQVAANGQFVMWDGGERRCRHPERGETPAKHNMRASAGVCMHFAPSISGRVDVARSTRPPGPATTRSA